jgi:hypothetical protein
MLPSRFDQSRRDFRVGTRRFGCAPSLAARSFAAQSLFVR